MSTAVETMGTMVRRVSSVDVLVLYNVFAVPADQKKQMKISQSI
jgi:hypothetical protein